MLIKLTNQKTKIVTKIKIYDDIDFMPYENRLFFERYLILHYTVGGSYSDIISDYKNLMQGFENVNREYEKKKMENLFQRIVYCVNNFSHELLALSCLLESQTKFDIDSLSQTAKMLIGFGITKNDIELINEKVKKKFLHNEEEEVMKTVMQYLK